MANIDYKDQNKLLYSTLIFSRNLVIKEIAALTNDIKEIKESLSKIVDPDDIPKDIKVSLDNKIKMKEKLEQDKKTIEAYLNKIKKIIKTGMAPEDENKMIRRTVSSFFTKHVNSNDGMNAEISGGKSQFERIVSSTNTYHKLADKINKLESKAAMLASKNIVHKNNKKNTYKLKGEEKLYYKIARLQNKVGMENDKQHMIMLKRQEVINKRNKKIAKLEAKRDYYEIIGKDNKAERLNKKMDKLKTKKIHSKGAKRIIFEQKIISLFSNSRFDKSGNYDYRTWSEKRVEALQDKVSKSL